MSSSLIHYFHLAHSSQPAKDRPIYRAIRRGKVKSIVEMGVAMGQRSKRLIEVATRYASGETVRYTGIDMFEARSSHAPGMTLKRAHRFLQAPGVKVQLIPGDPYMALARMANSLVGTDLVIIDADQDAEAVSQAWFYLPRMLHSQSAVFVGDVARSAKPSFRRVQPSEISERATSALHQRAA